MFKLKVILSKEIFYYLLAILVCCLFLVWVLQLWNMNLNIPFDYHMDTLANGASIKGIIDNGWYTSNSLIGAPYGYQFYDFNANVNLDMAIVKLISLVFPNWAATLNIYYLLTFPLVTIAALFVLRRLKVSRLTSLVGSILYTFIPFHFMQGESHINLSAYYLIPFAVMLCLWLFENDFSLKPFKEQTRREINWRAAGSIAICIGIGTAFVYYPFFTCFFLLIAGTGATISKKKWQPLVNSGILIAVIVLIVLLFSIPSFLYQHQNGVNQLLIRDPAETEVWGLKMVQLLLPVPGNNNPLLAALADRYQYSAPFVNENQSAALGIIGSIGFVILILWLFFRVFRIKTTYSDDCFNRIHHLSALNAAALILGTVGGLGTLIAYLVFPEIRTYTRISIFIAFFSILTICFLFDYLISKTTFSKVVVVALMLGILIVGINDQTSINFIPDYQGIKQEYQKDDKFVKNIEAKYPVEQVVFQLPYNAFPESHPPNNMEFYDLFRGYLHSESISWSYGCIKGRFGDFWYKQIAAKSLNEMIGELSFSGFTGIYVDSYGYADSGKEITTSISAILNVTPLTSDNSRLYFFDMTSFNDNLKSQFTNDEYQKKKTKALYPLYYEFKEGFSSLPADDSIHLSKPVSTIMLKNFTSNSKKITINCTFETGYSATSSLNIASSFYNDNLLINNAGYEYIKDIVVPPGIYEIKLSCDANPTYIPGKYKSTVFAVLDFRVEEND
jgi:hypothetical protein